MITTTTMVFTNWKKHTVCYSWASVGLSGLAGEMGDAAVVLGLFCPPEVLCVVRRAGLLEQMNHW